MRRCEPCNGTGWAQTAEDHIMRGMREGICCARCNGLGQVADTPEEIAKEQAGRKYKMHSIKVGTANSARKKQAVLG